MRQFNFVIIFIFCLALALFTMENSQPAVIQIVPGFQVQAAIALELLLAVGLGAVLAWLFNIWTHFQQRIVASGQIRQKNLRIQELESKVEQYQGEIQSLKLVLPPASADSSTQ
jgi:TRAP-type C4-dicarboxylate transport system permease small subunit